MQAFDVAPLPNQIAFPFMNEGEAVMPEAAITASSGRRSAGKDGTGYGPVVSVVAAAGAVLLALVASGAAKPLLMTLLASLAMLGAFFIFALIAGHIRLGERVRETDLVRLLADGLPDGALIASAEGGVLYANNMYEELVGRSASGGPLALDAAFAGEPGIAPAIYRLNRAARRREVRVEEFTLNGRGTGGSRQMRVTSRPLHKNSIERELGPLVLWTIADITEERSREQQRIEGLEERIALYDRLPVGLMAVGADGHVQHMNSTFAGWLDDDVRGQRETAVRLADLLSPDGAELMRAAARRAVPSATGLDLDVTAANGKLVPMRFFVRPGVGRRFAHRGP